MITNRHRVSFEVQQGSGGGRGCGRGCGSGGGADGGGDGGGGGGSDGEIGGGGDGGGGFQSWTSAHAVVAETPTYVNLRQLLQGKVKGAWAELHRPSAPNDWAPHANAHTGGERGARTPGRDQKCRLCHHRHHHQQQQQQQQQQRRERSTYDDGPNQPRQREGKGCHGERLNFHQFCAAMGDIVELLTAPPVGVAPVASVADQAATLTTEMRDGSDCDGGRREGRNSCVSRQACSVRGGGSHGGQRVAASRFVMTRLVQLAKVRR